MKIGVFFGSTTGNTESAAALVAQGLGEGVLLRNVTEASTEDFESVDVIVCGASTWDIGELQYDWADFLPTLKGVDLSGKRVAFFGQGDAIGYPYNYLDCLGEIWSAIKQNGVELIGKWPTEGYDFEESRAEIEPGWLLGLGLDEDNEPELTEPRIEQWLAQLFLELSVQPVTSS